MKEKSDKEDNLMKPDYNELDVTLSKKASELIVPDYNKLDLTMKMTYIDEKKEARKFYKEGLKHQKRDRLFDAISSFQKSLEYDPEFSLPRKKLARIYKDAGDEHSAAAYFREYIKMDEKDNESLSFLFDYYLRQRKLSDAADIMQIKAGIVKKVDKRREMLRQAADLYLLGKNYKRAREVYHIILQDEIYDPEIFHKLRDVYLQEKDHMKWKVCEQVLILNNQVTSGKATDFIEIFKAPGPLTTEIYEKIVHPGEESFRKYFAWMSPLFKLMEAETPPEILRLSEKVDEKSRDYQLYKECCHYLNMEIPQLRHYSGPSNFKFIADPMDAEYSLLYNDSFLNELNDPEKVFVFLNHLTIVKGGFIPLLNLSVSDIARIMMEIASMMLSFLAIFQSLPLDKAARAVKKSSKTNKFLEMLGGLQKKLMSFKLLGKSREEMELLVKKSAELLPEKLEEEKGLSYKNIMNRRFLELALQGFYFTADRISYYMIRDLLVSTRALSLLLSGKDALDRIEKFGLQPYIMETRNKSLKQRLGELFFFAMDSDLVNIQTHRKSDFGQFDNEELAMK